MTAVRLDDVWFSYGAESVLRGASLTLRAGEAVALLGRNGAGKTTLTKLVVALLQPVRGTVWLGEQPTSGKKPEDVANWTAYLFQHADQQLFARTVLEEVAFAPRQLGQSDTEAREVAADALARVGLSSVVGTHPYDLAPAERKLVALAAALAQRARVLVMDEPTQGLDRAGRDRVSRIVREVTSEGVAVLAVSQDLAFVAEALERSLVLVDGVLAYDGDSRALLWDADRLEGLDLEAPPSVDVARALGMPLRPVAVDEVVEALEERCREDRGPIPSRFADDQS